MQVSVRQGVANELSKTLCKHLLFLENSKPTGDWLPHHTGQFLRTVLFWLRWGRRLRRRPSPQGRKGAGVPGGGAQGASIKADKQVKAALQTPWPGRPL